MGFKQQKAQTSGGGGFKAKKATEAGAGSDTASATSSSKPQKTPEVKPSTADPLTAANLGLGPTETDIAIAKATSFRKWAKRMKLWIHPSIDIMVPIKGMGYGVVAVNSVSAGETIFAVPPGAYINPTDTDCANCPSAAIIDAHKPAIPDWTRAVLRLMAEKARGTKSPYAPWFECAVVPDDHLFLAADKKKDNKPEGGDEEVDTSLLDPALWGQSAVAQQLEDYNLEARYNAVKDFIGQHPNIWPPEPTHSDEHTGKKEKPAVANFRCFKECAAFVVSRNFHIEARQRPGPFLVPAVDFLNHSNRGKPHVKFILTGGREKGLTFEVRATQDLLPGKQVFHDYGELCNARLLVEFGFKLSNYSSDSVRISQRVFARMATQATLKLQQDSQDAAAKRPEEKVAADMQERVTFLARLGILYDEGLFILKGASSAASALQFGEAEQVLLDVLYCLSRGPKEWNDTKGKLARWWHVEGKKELGEAAFFGIAALEWLMSTLPSPDQLAKKKTPAKQQQQQSGQTEEPPTTNYMNESVRSVLTTDREKLQHAIAYLSTKAVAPSPAPPTAGGGAGKQEEKAAVNPTNTAEDDDTWETDDDDE